MAIKMYFFWSVPNNHDALHLEDTVCGLLRYVVTHFTLAILWLNIISIKCSAPHVMVFPFSGSLWRLPPQITVAGRRPQQDEEKRIWRYEDLPLSFIKLFRFSTDYKEQMLKPVADKSFAVTTHHAWRVWSASSRTASTQSQQLALKTVNCRAPCTVPFIFILSGRLMALLAWWFYRTGCKIYKDIVND